MMTSATYPRDVYETAELRVYVKVHEEAGALAAEEGVIDDDLFVVCYTDVPDGMPDDADVRVCRLADLAVDAPDDTGLIVDPDSDDPIIISAGERLRLAEAGEPFPPEGSVRLAQPADSRASLIALLESSVSDEPAVRRLWWCYYKLGTIPIKMLITFDLAGEADEAVLDKLSGAIEADPPAEGVILMNVDDIPDEPKAWLLANVPAFFDRSADRYSPTGN